MQQVAGFTPQAYTRDPLGQGRPPLSQQAVGMGRHIAQQASTSQMKAAPSTVADGDQALPTRGVHALPSEAVDSLMLQGLTGPVESLWAMSQFSVDTYQQAAGLKVQYQALKDAFEDVLQAGAVEVNGEVSDKMQALCDRLAQLQTDHGAVQQRLEVPSGGGEHTERPVLPEVMVSQVESAPLSSAATLPGEIQPQYSDTVESEVVAHFLQRPSDQVADLESRIVVLEESSTKTSASTLAAEVESPDDLDQKLSVLSRECDALGQRVNQYVDEQGPRFQELEDKLTSLHQRCDKLREWSADSVNRHRTEMQNLIEHHHQELEGRSAAQREEIADLQARYQDQIGTLQQELQNSHERIEKLDSSIHEDEARLQDKPTLTDMEANELREAIALRNKEFALLTEQNKMLQLRYDTLVASHQVDMDKVTTAHQGDLEQLKQEHQSMMRKRDQDISEIMDVVERYKSLLSKNSGVLAINESTVADFDAQLMTVTGVAEKLVSGFRSVHGKHSEVQGGLAAGREQLAEIVIMAKGLAEELAEHKLAGELTSMLGECSTRFANMQKNVDEVQEELDRMSGDLNSPPAVSMEPESSAADESDMARTYASVGRREAQV